MSPIYTQFVTETIGLSMSKSVFFPLSVPEQATLMVIALHMAICEEDCVEIMHGLSDYGTMIHDFWDAYVRAVRGHNESGVVQTTLNVNELMEKLRNDPKTQKSVGL